MPFPERTGAPDHQRSHPQAPSPALQKALTRLEQAVTGIQDSAAFRAYLDLQARFHRYSFSNALLILSQRPDATQVAGFHTWKQLGRPVRKGEHGIKIIVDPKSLLYLNGTTLEYEETLMRQGFVFQNPNAARNCGCGSSFTA